ncbi:hypothetical protein PFTANZ_06426, partial [Plasmodium falciparum Tanzania (2000708)]
MAPGGGQVGGDGIEHDKDAKNMFDRIGKDVYEQVKSETVNYVSELEGKLSQASILGELASSNDPCNSDYTTRFDARGDPCGSAGEKRFSKERVDEYDEKKIKDNKGKGGNNEGECAPYRRLSLCNKNLKNINNIDSDKARHNLLADVCLAANHEGQSIKTHLEQYDLKYPSGSGHTTCTALARSFADIGDIIRGRDLYRGGGRGRKQLEENLQKIFENIYNELTSSRNGKKGEIEARYNDTPYYYKLREDWWTANRETVWKALTCDDDNKLRDASYFRATCSDGKNQSQATKQCRCENKTGASGDGDVNIVPTYFDYVPQYLRWFEEWAEDFCRKKKKKVENLDTQCRGKDKERKDRYCSRNGFDCEQTVNARGKLRYGKQCISCLYACNPYVEWIEKQKEQFDKQKKKYDEEIKKYKNGTLDSGRRRQTRSAGGETATNYDGYEKKFYNILKTKYNDVNDFLKLLNKENVCKEVKDDKGGKINFENVNSGSASDSGTNDASQGTFSHSEYCQPCPLCGMKWTNKAGKWKWEHKKDGQCTRGNIYKPKGGKNGTPINFLNSGDRQVEIETKLKKFCDQINRDNNNGEGSAAAGGRGGSKSDSKELYEDWNCYKGEDVEKVKNGEEEDDEEDDKDYTNIQTGGGLCILENKNENKGSDSKSQNNHADIQKTFNDFFYYWVAHMLKDSIYWETQKLDKCINNNTNGNRCRNGCNKKCDCFKRWVNRKRTEWTNIKNHFYTQNINGTVGNGNSASLIGFTHDGVLKQVLELEFSNENTEEDKKNNVSAREIDLINKMLEEDKTTAAGTDNKNNTTIDKLLQHEEKKAQTCLETHNDNECNKQKQQQKQPAGGGAGPGRNLPGHTAGPVDSDEEEEDDADEVEEEEEEDGGPDGGDVGGEAKEQEEQPPPTTTTPGVNPCEIVKTLFEKPEDFNVEACSQKYGLPQRHWGWKCISGDKTATGGPAADGGKSGSDATTGGKDGATGKSGDKAATGGLCIPPRRRRLYVTPLTRLTGDNTETSQGKGAASTSSLTDATQLRDAFIQSAAIETFFLWDRYKKDKEKEIKEKNEIDVTYTSSVEKDPQEELQESGKIPDGFLRQMFYTLADYKDILFGDKEVIEVLKASGDKNIETIKKAIESVFNSGSEKNPSSSPGDKKPGQTTTKPTEWWKKYGPDIWEGMICALTYDTDSGGKEQAPTEDPTVKEAFFGTPNGNPVPTSGTAATQNGTYEKTYKYETVTLQDENSGGGAKSNDAPLLSHFISRPPYFRYLEEWGQNFCKERKKRLEKIKEECTEEGGRKQKCSCYGENCDDQLRDEPTTLHSLECPDCGKYCSSYKKWIQRKKEEFTEQKNAYKQQKEDAQKNNNNGFRKTLNTCDTAATFLQNLGPCSKNENGEDNRNENGKDKLDFTNPNETFVPADNCKPCSQFKIDCQKANCTGGGTNVRCNGKKKGSAYITASFIENGGNSTHKLDMRVSDNSPNAFEGNVLKEACKDAGIFKSIRKDEWTCGKVCGYNVCKPENVNGEKVSGEGNNENQIILITAFVKLWAENFLEDYNRIQKKLKPCIENGEEPKCENKCEQKCNCVKKWVEEKKQEWKNIKERYLEQYKNADESYPVKTILEEFKERPVLDKAIKPCPNLEAFESFCGLNGADNSKKSKDGKKRDIVECLLEKLENLKNKIKTCQNEHDKNSVQISDENQTQTCDDSSPSGEKHSTPVGDHEEPLEEENPVDPPKICPVLPEPEAEKEEDGCEAAPTTAESEEKPNPEDTPVPKPAPASPPPPRPKPRRPRRTPQLLDNPHVLTALMSSTIMWSIGIGFATFTYFYLK